MRRPLLVALLIATACVAGLLTFSLLTEPRDVDVSDCRTTWRNGRVHAVVCPSDVSR